MVIRKNAPPLPSPTYDILGLTQEEVSALRDFLSSRHKCNEHPAICRLVSAITATVCIQR